MDLAVRAFRASPGPPNSTELPAHRAELLRTGGTPIVHTLRLYRVDAARERPLPVEFRPCPRNGRVPFGGAGKSLGDITGVRRDPGGDNTVPHIIDCRKAQMFTGGDIAKEIRSVPRGDGASDCGGNVIVPRGDVAHEGTEDVEGIAVNDSIILVDAINQLRRDDLPLMDAITRAGQRRIRPIIMTSITTILALLPLTFGFGEGAALRAPMALAVIGGLISSTVLTLFVIPCVYYVLDGLGASGMKRRLEREG